MSSNKELCRRADTALANASYDPKKLVMIHSGAVCLVVLLLVLVDLGLNSMIEDTGGLSGMGFRAFLSTIQTVLQSIQQIVLPFWNFGYLCAVMRMAREEGRGPVDLLMGFRHFFPLMLTGILMLVILAVFAMAVFYLAVLVLAFTPLSGGALEMVDSLGIYGNMNIDDATAIMITNAFMPVLIGATVAGLLGVFILSYRFRMLFYCVFDDPDGGVRANMRQSRWLMKGNWKRLFLLDLHFWWYYLLSGLLAFVAYGDLLLASFGVTLPTSSTVGYLVFYGLYLVGQFALSVFAKNRISVAYALFYDGLI